MYFNYYIHDMLKLTIMEQSTQFNVFYIRHATSYFNLFCAFQKHESGLDSTSEDMEFLSKITDKFSPLLADPKLTSKGILQCSEAAPIYHELPIKCLFVSPLRRALHTALLLFKDHPLRSKMKVIVHPLLTEVVGGSNEISIPLAEKRKEYEEQGFDFSLLDQYEHPDMYFIYNINEPERTEVLNEVQRSSPAKSYVEVIANILKMRHISRPTRHRKLENYINLRKRAREFAQYTLKYSTDNGYNSGEVAAVSHETTIAHSLAVEFNYYSKAIYDPIDNCKHKVIDINTLMNSTY